MKSNNYTIILCCPCYMPKYVPRLEGIMHSSSECIMPSNLGTYYDPTSQITLSKRSDNVTFSLLQRKNFTF